MCRIYDVITTHAQCHHTHTQTKLLWKNKTSYSTKIQTLIEEDLYLKKFIYLQSNVDTHFERMQNKIITLKTEKDTESRG